MKVSFGNFDFTSSRLGRMSPAERTEMLNADIPLSFELTPDTPKPPKVKAPKAPKRGIFSRTGGALGWSIGLTAASIVGGIALMFTGPPGCLPGCLLLLGAPLIAAGGGLFGFAKRKH